MSRMEQFGVVDNRVNTTRLKQRLLAQIPDLRAHNKGRDVLLGFEEDIGAATGRVCAQDIDSDAVHLARTAQIVRRHMFEDTKHFNGTFEENIRRNLRQACYLH